MDMLSAPLTPQVRLGLLFIVLVSALSLLAVSALLLYICYNTIRNRYWPRAPDVEKWHFLRSHVDYYFLALLISNLFMSMGSLMTVTSLVTGVAPLSRIICCVVQGAITQIGNVGMALANLVIAVHTFSVLIMQWRPSNRLRLPLTVISIILLILLGLAAIQVTLRADFYGPSDGSGCWSEARSLGERLGLEYVFFWLAALLGIPLYVPLFFLFRGNIKVGEDVVTPDSGAKSRVQWQWLVTYKKSGHLEGKHWQWRASKALQNKVETQMIPYPIIYLYIIIPISITRWMTFKGKYVPYPATCFAAVMFESSGLVNTTLYLITRPVLLRALFGRRFSQSSPQAPDEAGGGAHGHDRVDISYVDSDHRNGEGGSSFRVTGATNDLEERSDVGTIDQGSTRREQVVGGPERGD
ncbi:hypothetical protein FRB99_007435 [Tulasnella sp. 403]|nr:hypothetical protein FRB99_007435 [Tulasnella sp. 403]